MKREDIVKTINGLSGEAGHKKVLDIYNAQKPLPRGYKLKSGDAWCAGTVSAVFLMNGYSDFSECSCPKMVEKAKAKGIWVENDAYVPQIGDVLMYDWQDSGKPVDDVGTPDHVGIVISIDKNKMLIREGNKSGSIGNRDVIVNQLKIRGYITPPYEKETKPTANTPKPEKAKETAQTSSQSYSVGKTYTISVKSALNVRKGAGTQYGLVGYNSLTADAKRHAIKGSSALKSGTKVTCNAVQKNGNDIWMKIPSGWVCAKSGNNIYIK